MSVSGWKGALKILYRKKPDSSLKKTLSYQRSSQEKIYVRKPLEGSSWRVWKIPESLPLSCTGPGCAVSRHVLGVAAGAGRNGNDSPGHKN
jgi:hypothetical protein